MDPTAPGGGLDRGSRSRMGDGAVMVDMGASVKVGKPPDTAPGGDEDGLSGRIGDFLFAERPLPRYAVRPKGMIAMNAATQPSAATRARDSMPRPDAARLFILPLEERRRRMVEACKGLGPFPPSRNECYLSKEAVR